MRLRLAIAISLSLFALETHGAGAHALKKGGAEPTGDDNRRVLRQDGFAQWGCSDVFVQGPFAVEAPVKGGITVSLDAFPDVDLSKTTGIHVGKIGPADNSSPILGLFTNGRYQFSSFDGYSGSGDDVPKEMNTKLSIPAQLERAGFREEPKGCGVFRKAFGNNNILALVEDGKLRQIVRSATHPLLSGASIRAGYQEAKDGSSATLNFAGPGLRFSFSSEHGGHVPGESAEFFKDLKETRPKILDVTPVTPAKDKASDFIIGGKNATKTIQSLKSLNGQTIAQLEKRMRPGKDSGEGFLGKNESLLKVLADDNDFVVGKKGLTHQALAAPMHLVRLLAENGLHTGKNIVYNGQRLRIEAMFTHGTQPSPFEDGTNHGANVVVKNLDTNESVSFGLLLPYMIERYGFYEGRGTSYRVEPAAIIRVFGLDRR